MFTDTHCHILSESYDNIDEIFKLAEQNNVNRFIVSGYNLVSSLEVLDMIKKYNNVYGCIGLHPENCNEDFNYELFKNLPDKIVAIGEIGLDYHYGKDDKEKQIDIFRKQLKIAEDLHLPVVIHSRDATEDTINVLRNYHLKGVIHSFSGSVETARIYLSRGYKLGVNGVITFKNAKLKDLYKELSPHDIVLETDSPYLAPEPHRGEQNSPKNILDIATYVAAIYGITLEELARNTNENIRQIFDI